MDRLTRSPGSKGRKNKTKTTKIHSGTLVPEKTLTTFSLVHYPSDRTTTPRRGPTTRPEPQPLRPRPAP